MSRATECVSAHRNSPRREIMRRARYLKQQKTGTTHRSKEQDDGEPRNSLLRAMVCFFFYGTA